MIKDLILEIEKELARLKVYAKPTNDIDKAYYDGLKDCNEAMLKLMKDRQSLEELVQLAQEKTEDFIFVKTTNKYHLN